MLESEIIKNLGLLKNISPKAEYSSLSKSIILSSEIAPEKSVVKKLAALRNIFPSNEFARATRELILAYPKTFAGKLGRILSPANFAGQGVKYGTSLAIGALLLVISVSSFSGAVPEVDTKNLTAEAETIVKDIDINLEGAEYFATIANKTRVALTDAKSNGAIDHSNQELIKNEVRSFNFENPTGQDINKLLNEATL